MSSKKKNLFRTLCYGSCGCGKTKASEEIHEPITNPKISIHHKNAPSTYPPSSIVSSSFTASHNCAFSMEDEESISTTISDLEIIPPNHENNNNTILTKQSPLMDSLAVEKDTSDPYRDFRHSMLQMIFEKEIDSEDDLQDLLQCFLQLNSPYYHLMIIEAFNQICEEAFPEKVCSIGRSPISQENHIIIRKITR